MLRKQILFLLLSVLIVGCSGESEENVNPCDDMEGIEWKDLTGKDGISVIHTDGYEYGWYSDLPVYFKGELFNGVVKSCGGSTVTFATYKNGVLHGDFDDGRDIGKYKDGKREGKWTGYGYVGVDTPSEEITYEN